MFSAKTERVMGLRAQLYCSYNQESKSLLLYKQEISFIILEVYIIVKCVGLLRINKCWVICIFEVDLSQASFKLSVGVSQ